MTKYLLILSCLCMIQIGCKESKPLQKNGKVESTFDKDTLDKIQKEDTVLSSAEEEQSEIKQFTINPETGEVDGCPHLKLIGEVNYEEEMAKKRAIRTFKDSISPILRELIPKDEYDLWYGDPQNVGESAHDGMGPLWVDKSDDGQKIIVPVGYPHGGDLTSIYFFDGDMNFLNKYTFDKILVMPFFRFNPEQTFYIVESGVRGYYYFFTSDGELFRSGDFEETTGDNRTSYGGNTISETGKYWLLANNSDYLFEDDSLEITFEDNATFRILENEKLIMTTGYEQVSDNQFIDVFFIYDFTGKTKYNLRSKNDSLRVRAIIGKELNVKSLTNNKTFKYELF